MAFRRGFDSAPIGQETVMIRRMLRQVGSMAVVTFLWQHRGSVVRTTDLARRLPQLVTTGKTDDALTEAKMIMALDGSAPTSTEVRITGIDDGAVTLRGDLPASSLEAARHALLSVPDVLDVRTDAADQPTFDDCPRGGRPLMATDERGR